MQNRRWWDAAVIAASLMVIVALAVGSSGASSAAAAAAGAALALFVLSYLLVARPALTSPRPWHFPVFVAGAAVALAGGCAGEPFFAILQAIAYPLTWVLAGGRRRAIAGSIVIALGTFTGFALFSGILDGGDAVLPALAIAGAVAGFGLAFAIAFGLWIASVVDYGEERARLVGELTAAQAEIEALSRDRGAAMERERLARDVHDTLAQTLAGLAILSERAGRQLGEGRADAAADSIATVDDSRATPSTRLARSCRARPPSPPMPPSATPWTASSAASAPRLDSRSTSTSSSIPPGCSPASRSWCCCGACRSRSPTCASTRRLPGLTCASRPGLTGEHSSRSPTTAADSMSPRGVTASASRAWRSALHWPAANSRCRRSPAAAPRSSCGCPRRRRPGGRAMIRLLIVDDHPVVRAGLVGMLSDEPGFEVVGEASDGDQAARVAAATRPDVVLMDLRMPGVGGVEATAQITAAGDAKVLILTTYESDDQILAAIEAGASGYLLKAAPQAEIVAGIRSVAAGQTALRRTWPRAWSSACGRRRPKRYSPRARRRCCSWSPEATATSRSPSRSGSASRQ